MSGQKQRSHPTQRALIDAVVELLEIMRPEDIKVEDVLERSGISSGSLYHHFENLADLIDHAMIARYSDDIDASIAALTQLARTVTTTGELAAGLLGSTVRTASEDRRDQRAIRVQTMTRAASSERFRAVLAPEQQRLNDAVADVWRELQLKGLFDPSLDPAAGSVFVQAYNLGLIVNDMTENPVDQAALTALIHRMLERSFFVEG
jgi:AcrR family transcriptional regulator